MTNENQIELFEEFTNKQKDILLKKRNDYANEDVMSNFKQVGFITDLKPEQSILVLIATKVARLGNLLSGKEPKNESIDDTIIDMANYCFLLYCLRNENKNHTFLRGKVEFKHEENRDLLKDISELVENRIKDSIDIKDKLNIFGNGNYKKEDIETLLRKSVEDKNSDEMEKYIELVKKSINFINPHFPKQDYDYILEILNKILDEKRASQNAGI